MVPRSQEQLGEALGGMWRECGEGGFEGCLNRGEEGDEGWWEGPWGEG